MPILGHFGCTIRLSGNTNNSIIALNFSGYLNIILCSCVVLPEFYGISSHITHVCSYNFTKRIRNVKAVEKE